jgi:hypothetical protein
LNMQQPAENGRLCRSFGPILETRKKIHTCKKISNEKDLASPMDDGWAILVPDPVEIAIYRIYPTARYGILLGPRVRYGKKVLISDPNWTGLDGGSYAVEGENKGRKVARSDSYL